MEFLPFRCEFNTHTGEAYITGKFKVDISQVPDPESTRKELLAGLEAELLARGLPEDLKGRRDQLTALLQDLGNQVEASKANIHRLADERDGLWKNGVPTVQALEKADAAIDQEKQRYGNLVAHLDHARARMDDLHGAVGREMKAAAREAVAKASEFTPAERKAIDTLLGLFAGAKAETLLSACQRQRTQYDFLPGDRGGGWIGSADSISAKVASQLLAPPAAEVAPEVEPEAEQAQDLVEVGA